MGNPSIQDLQQYINQKNKPQADPETEQKTIHDGLSEVKHATDGIGSILAQINGIVNSPVGQMIAGFVTKGADAKGVQQQPQPQITQQAPAVPHQNPVKKKENEEEKAKAAADRLIRYFTSFVGGISKEHPDKTIGQLAEEMKKMTQEQIQAMQEQLKTVVMAE